MITYLRGDATCPQARGPKVIAHVCNDAGGWGRGFVLALSARWSRPEEMYRRWYRLRKPHAQLLCDVPGSYVLTTGDFVLGEAQFVQVLPDTFVANMIGQAGTRTGSKGPPVRYAAISDSLAKVAEFASQRSASVHMPRIGCGLAGGTWDRVEPIVVDRLSSMPTYVYDWS